MEATLLKLVLKDLNLPIKPSLCCWNKPHLIYRNKTIDLHELQTLQEKRILKDFFIHFKKVILFTL